VFIPAADTIADCDGSSSAGVGSCDPIANGDALVSGSADFLDYNNDATADGDILCTDSLDAPSIIAIDDDANCANGAGGTVLVGTVDGSETIEVQAAWGFTDADADGLLDDGEDMYVDTAPVNVYYDTGGTTLVVDPVNGNVGVQSKRPTQTLDVNGNARFRNVGAGTFAYDLNLTADGTLTTSTSDRRLKTNLEPLSDTLSRVLELQAYRFNWISDPAGSDDIGLMAQDVELLFPELVFTNKTDGTKGINYSRLGAILIESVKDQHKTVSSLSADLEHMTIQTEQLQEQLAQLQEDMTTLSSVLTVTDGTVSIDAETVTLTSATEPLQIQPQGNQGVTFVSNMVAIDTKGNIHIKDGVIKGNDRIRGIDEAVEEGRKTHTIQFRSPRPSDAYAISITPSWMTMIMVHEKTATSCVVEFSEPAPDEGTIDWIIVD
jgi:hypothetical protein